ncbi:MAG TPA: type ISP restriction/modification enzyme [Candidatus Sulfotelmatobacter sp.]|nr:type ISP restriction/modification enzyme [Candidatus Sulfotelmatobacter sp.]
MSSACSCSTCSPNASFRKIFNNPDFSHRNVVAAEIEKVIAELTKRSLNRDDFLKKLEPFYHAIERNAENATDYTAKQDFLNTVYMRFFQGYSPKEADTHGIVYTPQPIVNFMVRSVEEILQKEFGRSLSDKGVHILDPFVGTGNFITRIMQEIKTTDLPYKYENELHCNEVMLLPYYIASMNIEHAYYERVGEYRAFPGICLVDTFELAEAGQGSFGFMTAENAERVIRQKGSPIFVIVGNPPYNAWQVDENDNNRNRKYIEMEKRISETYVRDSKATLMNSLRDPYVKALRWSTDRIGSEGIVALITNSGFIDSVAADGIRKHLAQDFDEIYALDLGGDVRLNPKLSGTTHNVFGIKIGVSINLFVRHSNGRRLPCKIHYAKTDEFWRREQKYEFLESAGSRNGIRWQDLVPDHQSNWINAGQQSDFGSFFALGNKELKSMSKDLSGVVFGSFSNGAKSNNDSYVYNFVPSVLKANARAMVDGFNAESDRWRRAGRPKELDRFLDLSVKKLKWIRHTKRILVQGHEASFNPGNVRTSLYRPFCAVPYYFDRVFNEDLYSLPKMLPTTESENENRLIVAPNVGGRTMFWALCSNRLPNLSLISIDANQCFPFYTYAEDGTHRRENITDWALEQFRSHYADPSITKWDIFHYVYAVLHHPDYRQRYAANLRRELPRIPFVGTGAEALDESAPDAGLKPGSSTEPAGGTVIGAPVGAGGPMHVAARPTTAYSTVEERPFQGRVTKRKKENNSTLPKAVAAERSSQATGAATTADTFRAFVKAGQRLAEIHVQYEQQPEYPLKKIEKKGETLDYRVTKMKLSKDKTQLIYNQFLTLDGIPPETYEYRLGNRSALEWVIDQYQVSTDKRSGITNDPNREDDPTYILRLIGQVITLSLETVRIVKALPELKVSHAMGS